MKKFFSVISVIALVFIMTIPAFASAPGSLPPAPAKNPGAYDYADIVVYDSSTDEVWLHRLETFRSPFTADWVASRYPESHTVRYTGKAGDNVGYIKYELDRDTNTWVMFSNNTYATAGSIYFTTDLTEGTLYSNKIIQTGSGDDFFFPKTGLEARRVMAMAGREIQAVIPQWKETAWILILCGVGCLALLISAPLLLKVFRIFRV